MHENKYSYKCLRALRRRLQAFYSKLGDICFCWLLAAIFVPLRGTQTWCLHPWHYKFEQNISSNISRTKHRTDLNLCETVWIFIFFYLFDSWLYLLNGFDDGVTVKTGIYLTSKQGSRANRLAVGDYANFKFVLRISAAFNMLAWKVNLCPSEIYIFNFCKIKHGELISTWQKYAHIDTQKLLHEKWKSPYENEILSYKIRNLPVENEKHSREIRNDPSRMKNH